MSNWFKTIYEKKLGTDGFGLQGCAGLLKERKDRNKIMKDEQKTEPSLIYTPNQTKDELLINPCRIIQSMLYYHGFELTDGVEGPDDADHIYKQGQSLEEIACYIMRNKDKFWEARRIRYNTSSKPFHAYGMSRQDVFEKLFGAKGMIPYFETHGALWKNVYKGDLQKVYEKVKGNKLSMCQLWYTGDDQFSQDVQHVGDSTAYKLGKKFRELIHNIARFTDNVMIPFVGPHGLPTNKKPLVQIDHGDGWDRAYNAGTFPTEAPKWFLTIYEPEHAHKIGLPNCGKELVEKYKKKLDEIMKDERNSTAHFIYERANRDTFRITPEVIIESLLYYGMIPLETGPYKPSNIQLLLKTPSIERIACTLMQNEPGYWAAREMRHDTDDEKVAFGLTMREIYTKLYGTAKEQGLIPFVDNHAELWNRVLKKTDDLEEVYKNGWKDIILKSQLAWTGSAKYSGHKIKVKGKTTYEWGQEWRALLKTDCKDASLHKSWLKLDNLEEEASRHAQLCGDIRLRNCWLHPPDVAATMLQKPGAPKEEKVVEADTFREEEWFQRITGMIEKEWNKQNFGREYMTLANSGEIRIKNPTSGKIYSGGILHYMDLKTLRGIYATRNKDMIHDKKVNPITISKEDETNPDKKRPNTDVRALMLRSEVKNHMFQAASQFDGLECGDDKTSRNTDTFLTYYVYDPTQGPAVSVAAGPAAIVRRDGIYAKDEKFNWSQAPDDRNINYLDDLAPYFKVHRGYVTDDKNGEDLPKDSKARNDLAGKAKVMFNQNCKIYYNTTQGIYEMLPEPQNVHQIFVAAMNIKQNDSGRANGAWRNEEERLRVKDRVMFLLRVAYETTYLAAHYCKAEGLWLTLVGAGAFGNELPWILEVINDVHQGLGGGLDVHIVDYTGCLAKNEQGRLIPKPPKPY